MTGLCGFIIQRKQFLQKLKKNTIEVDNATADEGSAKAILNIIVSFLGKYYLFQTTDINDGYRNFEFQYCVLARKADL